MIIQTFNQKYHQVVLINIIVSTNKALRQPYNQAQMFLITIQQKLL